MPRKNNERNWKTEDEISFLNGLGAHGYGGAEPYCVLLSRYVQAAELRVNWGKINKKKVIQYAKEGIKRLCENGEKESLRSRCSMPLPYNVGITE